MACNVSSGTLNSSTSTSWFSSRLLQSFAWNILRRASHRNFSRALERSPILHLGMSERLNREHMMLNGLFIITIMCQFLHDELALYL